jgi:hypothetical protein
MGRELGRISGPLLASNLRRNGVDLQFENSLLYLDVNSPRLGINSYGPSSDLTVGIIKNDGSPTSSTIQTVNLITTDTSNIGNFVISSDNIQHLTSTIYIRPNQATDPAVSTPGLSTDDLYFSNNNLITTTTDTDINFTPTGTGRINLSNDSGTVDVTVDADLHATGDITWDGNITFGNVGDPNDVVTFKAEVDSDIIPLVQTTLVTPVSEPYLSEDLQVLLAEDGNTLYTNPAAPYYQTTYLWDLGTPSLRWRRIYTQNLFSEASTLPSDITADTVNIGSFVFSGNNISIPDNDIMFHTTGTGNVKFNNWPYIVDNNTFLNPTNSTQQGLTLQNVANGYVKFTGSNGIVLPVGTTLEQPPNPVTGATRWNTDQSYVEIYNGTIWIPAYGTAVNATSQDAEDFSVLYTIVFGY